MSKKLLAASLFSSGGLGDLALRAAGFEILVSNELLQDRHEVFKSNFPETIAVNGDIWQVEQQIAEKLESVLDGRELTLLYATPPCQGMSKNGRGKLLSAVRAGRKPALDERNRLIFPALSLAKRLRPEIVLFENVPEMASTLVEDESGELIGIIDAVERALGPEYAGGSQVVEFADYGVPQCRQRLITVFSRTDRCRSWFSHFGTLLPPPTHSQNGRQGTLPWVTVRDVISDVPALDASTPERATSSIPLHRVPILDEMKYWWVQHTPESQTAFDNQCVECGYDKNPIHSSGKTKAGINRASKTTPIHCSECDALLPRPSVLRNGKRALMRGYKSAYKRMSWDRPASALTRNLSYACSDNKLHPSQNRVLSLYEALLLHTVAQYDYEWSRADGKKCSDKTIREIIGESIPPHGLQKLVEHIRDVYAGEADQSVMFGPLFQVAPLGEAAQGSR